MNSFSKRMDQLERKRDLRQESIILLRSLVSPTPLGPSKPTLQYGRIIGCEGRFEPRNGESNGDFLTRLDAHRHEGASQSGDGEVASNNPKKLENHEAIE